MRVVPAAVGTDLQVFDARSSDSGRVAAVVRQRSEMAGTPGPSWRCSSRTRIDEGASAR